MLKIISGLTMASILAMSTIAPALANGQGTFNTLLGAGAATLFLTQSAHNRHQHAENVNLYNDDRMGTFEYNGKTVNCHMDHGMKACYQRNGPHDWQYIPKN